MTRLDPPGFLNDFTEDQKDQWSELISSWLDEAIAGNPTRNDGPRGQFFNPLKNPPAADAEVAVISWSAFPRRLNAAPSDRQRWRTADSDRNEQDEYCEWSVVRDPVTSKITKVMLTCEGPEYWQALASVNPAKVLELYREFVSPDVEETDLFIGGEYNPLNVFNNSTSRGAMHLIQPANNLGAEIELAGAATIRRLRNGVELSGAQELILCSGYGEARRNSDPHIGEQVNAAARTLSDITLNNPVGLYFNAFNPVGWVTPDGEDPKNFWKYVRGTEGHFVRAVFEVPAEKGYTVGDIRIGTRPIEFGAQIVDFVTIKLEGLVTRKGLSKVKAFNGCRGEVAAPPSAAGAAAPPSGIPQRVMAISPAPTRRQANLTAAPAAAPVVTPLPDRLQSQDEAAAGGAAPPALLPYPKLPLDTFRAIEVAGEIIAYASPDSTFAVTKKLIDSARRSIVIGIYDFDASYIKNPLKDAMRRGVSVSMMLDLDSRDQPGLFNELRALGANCVAAPSKSNPVKYFDNAHEKIICIDDSVVMVQSGNWSENSIPFNPGDGEVVGDYQTGNRDMGLAVQSRELTRMFSELIARDMRLAQGLPPDATGGAVPPTLLAAAPPDQGIFAELAPDDIPGRLFKSLSVTSSQKVKITPAVSPENFHDVAKGFLRSAKRTILIEQQYIRGNQPAVIELLDAMKAARADNPGLQIKIIVSPKYLDGNNRINFLKAMEDYEFEFGEHYRFLSTRHFVHCHNKLIVVDDRVLLGSQNWSTTALKSNREASLLVEHAGITGYFANIFDADWDMSQPATPTPEAALVGAENIVPIAAFANGGVVVSSFADYEDV